MRPMPPKPSAKSGTAKTFTIEKWDGSKTGEKIILYGRSGAGKTTLASMAPNPVFIGLDDGGRKIKNPKTGKFLQHIPGIKTFDDVRNALNACIDLDCQTVVIDTITELELLGEEHTLKTVPGPKGKICKNIKSYGWQDGYKYQHSTMRLPLLNCDRVIEAGKNIIAIAQLGTIKMSNDLGEDSLKEGPQLYHSDKGTSVYDLWNRWADHIFRIRPQSSRVMDGKKKAVGDVTRVIDTEAGLVYEAKSRTLDDPVISFSTKDDDSLWQLLFNQGE